MSTPSKVLFGKSWMLFPCWRMEWLNCLRALSTNYMNCMYMDCIWTVLKLYMDCTWTILDYFCTVHVQVKIYAQWKTIWLLFFKKNPLTHQFLEISLNFLFCCSFSKTARHILNFHCCLYSSTFWILCILYKLYCAICESTVNLFICYIYHLFLKDKAQQHNSQHNTAITRCHDVMMAWYCMNRPYILVKQARMIKAATTI